MNEDIYMELTMTYFTGAPAQASLWTESGELALLFDCPTVSSATCVLASQNFKVTTLKRADDFHAVYAVERL